MRVVNIEEVLKYIQDRDDVSFDDILDHFGAETNENRARLRNKVCRLVRQGYLVKTGPNSWRTAA